MSNDGIFDSILNQTTFGPRSAADAWNIDQVNAMIDAGNGNVASEWNDNSGPQLTITYSFIAPGSNYDITEYPPNSAFNVATLTAFSAIQKANIREAIARWEAVANIDLVEVTETQSLAGDIRIGMSDSASIGGSLSYDPDASSDRAQDGDIWFQSADFASESFAPGTYAFTNTMNALGRAVFNFGYVSRPSYTGFNGLILDGTVWDKEYWTVMSEQFVQFQRAQTPMYLDIVAAKAIKGDMSIHVGDDVYHVDDTFRMTIWDEGGMDEVVWDSAQHAYIDLTPGKLTAVNGGFSILDADRHIGWSGSRDNAVDLNLSEFEYRFFIAPESIIENARGNAGNDYIRGNSAANLLIGQGGQDTLLGEGSVDILRGGRGSDTLDGGADVDWADFSDLTLGVTVNLITGTATSGLDTDTLISIQNAIGSAFGDTFIGNGENNVFDGHEGDDTMIASLGNDIFRGHEGVDTVDYSGLTAAVSVDLLNQTATALIPHGGQPPIPKTDFFLGVENVNGTAFDDMLISGGVFGLNTMRGGPGNDTYVLNNFVGIIENAGEGSADKVIIPASYTLGDSIENLELTGSLDFSGEGNAANNDITGNSGNNFLDGREGADIMRGSFGDDFYVVDNAGDQVIENPTTFGIGFLFYGIDTVQTSLANYTLPANVEKLNGFGVGTGQTLTGNAESNVITFFGFGDVTLAGLGGADSLAGGFGFDTASYAGSPTAVIVNLATGVGSGGDAQGDTLISIENLTGSAFNDSLTGDAINNLLTGGGGADSLNGGGGFDTASYAGSPTAVMVNLATGIVSGGDAQGDTFTSIENLTGSAFNDTLTGDTQANVVTGGAGNDSVDGGIGSDRVIFSGARSQYEVARLANGSIRVTDQRAGSPDGIDTVFNVELFQFADATYTPSQFNNAPQITLPLGAAVQATSKGQVFQASQLFSASDIDTADTLTYAVVDFSPGGGNFRINGQPISGNVMLLTAAQLAQTTFQSGLSGTDNLRFGVNDTPGANLNSAGWVTRDFSVIAAVNHAPTISLVAGANVQATSQGQVFQLSQLVTASDVDNDTLTYAVVDFSAGGGNFRINGQPMSGNVMLLTAAQLAQTTFQAGLNGSIDSLRFGVNDTPGATLNSAGWVTQDFSVSAPVNHAPQLTLLQGTNVQGSHGQVFQVSQLASASDADNDTLTYAVVDFTPGGGNFSVGGQPISGNVMLLSAAQLAQTAFQASLSGTDQLRIGVNDTPGANLNSAGWVTQDFSVSGNHAPQLNLLQGANVQGGHGQVFQVSQLASASDADNDTLTYAVVDFTPGGGNFSIGGQPISGNVMLLTAAQLAQTTFQSGLSGTDQLRIGVNDTPGATLNSAGWVTQDFSVSGNHAPTITLVAGSNVQATSEGQVFQASELFTASDADNDTLTFALVDFSPDDNSGRFFINGQPMAGNVIQVTAAQLAQTTFQSGLSGTDHLRFGVNDTPGATLNSAGWVTQDFDVSAWLLT